jgi:competence protein ComEA
LLNSTIRWVVTFVTHASIGAPYVRAMPSEGSRTTAAIWVVAGLLAVFAVARLTSSHSSGGGAPVEVSRAAPAASAGTAAAESIYVHVAGAVRAPGLLKLRKGARVATAVNRAGGPGPKADLAGVNLAARLEDGQQVLVPVRGAPPPAAGSATSGPGTDALAGAPKPSLGTATVEQLDQIDGIGPTLAQRIVEYRTEHGGFRSLGELREVEGIGEKRFETLREALQP